MLREWKIVKKKLISSEILGKSNTIFLFILRPASRNAISLHVEVFSAVMFEDTHNYDTVAFPYHSSTFRAIFVYGTDYKRESELFTISNSVKIIAALIVSLLTVSIITLHAIRRRFGLPGNGVGSIAIDSMIPFIGGGNLQMEHRFERWFFGILLVGAFFIVSVFGGDMVDSVVRIINSKVETFDDLSKINPTIYIESKLANYEATIADMLK